MSQDAPKTHLGIAAVAAGVGGAAMLGMLFVAGGVASMFLFALPWLLGVIGLYNGVRAAMLPRARQEDIEDRGRRALHFSIFSLSISGIFLFLGLIVLMAFTERF